MNLNNVDILNLIFKAFFVFGAIIYFIFASIVVRQVQLMTTKVLDMYNTILITISWLHLLLAFLLVVSTLFL